MRLQIGDVPTAREPSPEVDGFVRIAGPSSRLAHLSAALVGIAMLTVLLALIIGAALLTPDPFGDPFADEPAPSAVIAATLVLAVPAHELLHALFYPDGGWSPATSLVIWPRKLRFGVYYEGQMTRRRWLVMRLAPAVFLSIAPTFLMMAVRGIARNFAVETSLAILILINALGSGGDVLATAWVLHNIPGGATLSFRGGKAYWRPRQGAPT
jgi:Putative zincin peptidase